MSFTQKVNKKIFGKYSIFGKEIIKYNIFNMPGLIGISEFVDETMDDYNSPTTSTFVAKMPQCRQTVSGYEDVSIECIYEYISIMKQ